MLKSYLSAHSHSHIVLILLSVLVGMVAMGLVAYYPHAHTAMLPAAEAQGLPNWDDAFVQVAAKTMPAVVTIQAVQVVPGSSAPNMRDLFKDLPPWFQFPFGNEESGGQDSATPPPDQRVPIMGSGWIYSPDGYIITNNHVVAGAKDLRVKLHDVENDIREYPAKLIGTDPKTELAVIKIDAPRKLPTLELGDSKNAKVGQWVMAVGAPFEYEQSCTAGIISAKGRTLRGESKYVQLGDIIQTDASINPGNSGGPLMDLHGQVVGINVAIAAVPKTGTPTNAGIGFAIPAETAQQIIPELIKSKKIVRGYLGIQIRDLSENMREFFGVPDGGALVEGVTAGGPSAKSDLQVQDVVVAVNGQKVQDTYGLQKAVGGLAPGVRVTLDVVRNKQHVQVAVTLGALPENLSGLEEPTPPAQPPAAGTETPAQPTIKALGITVAKLTDEEARAAKLDSNAGVTILKLDPNSPASDTLDKGMIILRVNHDTVNTLSEFKAAMEKAQGAGLSYIILQVMVNQEGEWIASTAEISLGQ